MSAIAQKPLTSEETTVKNIKALRILHLLIERRKAEWEGDHEKLREIREDLLKELSEDD